MGEKTLAALAEIQQKAMQEIAGPGAEAFQASIAERTRQRPKGKNQYQ